MKKSIMLLIAIFSLCLVGVGTLPANAELDRVGAVEPRFRNPRVVATSPSQGELESSRVTSTRTASSTFCWWVRSLSKAPP